MRNLFVILLIAIIVPVTSPISASALIPGNILIKDSVYAKTDVNTISIGQQLKLELIYKGNSSSKFNWPETADTFSTFEIISKGKIDTLTNNQDTLLLKRDYVLTSFDSGYPIIPPFTFIITGSDSLVIDSLSTRPILITVHSVAVDTTAAFKDIKDIRKVAFSWMDIIPWILSIIALTLITHLIIRYARKRKVLPEAPVQIAMKPAHIIAMEKLKKLDQEKLWQQGNYRQYYTGLSDIIRQFIEDSWSINAMEMTTDEILTIQKIRTQPNEIKSDFHSLMETCDLVKFAKVIPLGDENIQSMNQAIRFVENNKAAENKEQN